MLTCKFNLDHGPSDRWFNKFEAKHNHLKWAVPQTIDSVRVNQSTDYIIDDFFNKYGMYVKAKRSDSVTLSICNKGSHGSRITSMT